MENEAKKDRIHFINLPSLEEAETMKKQTGRAEKIKTAFAIFCLVEFTLFLAVHIFLLCCTVFEIYPSGVLERLIVGNGTHTVSISHRIFFMWGMIALEGLLVAVLLRIVCPKEKAFTKILERYSAVERFQKFYRDYENVHALFADLRSDGSMIVFLSVKYPDGVRKEETLVLPVLKRTGNVDTTDASYLYDVKDGVLAYE